MDHPLSWTAHMCLYISNVIRNVFNLLFHFIMDSEEEAVTSLFTKTMIGKKQKQNARNEETGQFWLNLG